MSHFKDFQYYELFNLQQNLNFPFFQVNNYLSILIQKCSTTLTLEKSISTNEVADKMCRTPFQGNFHMYIKLPSKIIIYNSFYQWISWTTFFGKVINQTANSFKPTASIHAKEWVDSNSDSMPWPCFPLLINNLLDQTWGNTLLLHS